MAVDNLELAAILGRNGCCHLHVFFRVAVPLFLLLRANTNIEAVGMISKPCELAHHNTAINSSGEKHGDALPFQIFTISNC